MTTDIEIRYQSLKKKLDSTQRQIDELRDRCPHTKATKIPRANTGNWDQTNFYWYECSCPWCGKYWTEDR